MRHFHAKQAENHDREQLERLVQLYQYDLSHITQADVDSRAEYKALDLMSMARQRGWVAYVLTVDDRTAGFAMICEHESFVGVGRTHWVDEFFVMRKYRGQGSGRWLANWVFDRHPGAWEVGETMGNLPAQSFWRSVIQEHTNDRFTDCTLDDERWRGPVQAFRSRGDAGP